MNNEHNESREDYLESILILKKRKGMVRSIDIADYFNYSRPSISRAMSLLREGDLITMDKSGYIELTDAGLEIAKSVYSRHTMLVTFLELIGVNPETATDDACRIEHVLSEESVNKLKEFVDAHQNL